LCARSLETEKKTPIPEVNVKGMLLNKTEGIVHCTMTGSVSYPENKDSSIGICIDDATRNN